VQATEDCHYRVLEQLRNVNYIIILEPVLAFKPSISATNKLLRAKFITLSPFLASILQDFSFSK